MWPGTGKKCLQALEGRYAGVDGDNMSRDSMTSNDQHDADRRAYPRHNIDSAAELKVSIGVLGSKPSDAEVVDIRRQWLS